MMKNQPRFSGWHVFVTLFALLLCTQILSALFQFTGEQPEFFRAFEWGVSVWILMAALFVFGEIYLVKELWAQVRLGRNQRRRLR